MSDGSTVVMVPTEAVVFRTDLYPRIEKSPRTVQQYAESLDLWVLESGIALWCPPLGRIIGEISGGTFFCRDSLGVEIWRAWTQAVELTPPRFRTEADFAQHVCEELGRADWTTRREVKCGPGRIDIVAARGNDVRIIEVKLGADSDSMAHALGQLLFRAAVHPSASLWVASPKTPSPAILQTLAAHGVTFLEGTWTATD